MVPAICIASVVVLTIAAIPQNVWNRILDQALEPRGRLRLRHFWRDVREASNFVAGFLLSLVILTSLLIGLTVVLDARTRAAEEARMPNVISSHRPIEWNTLIVVQPAEVASAMSRLPLMVNASPTIGGRNVLWFAMCIAAGLTVAGIALVARITSRSYRLPMDQWVVELSAKHRQRIANRYLRTTAQRDARWHRQEERNQDGGPPNRSQQNA